MRVKRDILRRSTIGAMFTNRNNLSSNLPGSKPRYGVDAAFVFTKRVGGRLLRAYRHHEPGRDNESFQGKFEWVPDRYGVRADS